MTHRSCHRNIKVEVGSNLVLPSADDVQLVLPDCKYSTLRCLTSFRLGDIFTTSFSPWQPSVNLSSTRNNDHACSYHLFQWTRTRERKTKFCCAIGCIRVWYCLLHIITISLLNASPSIDKSQPMYMPLIHLPHSFSLVALFILATFEDHSCCGQ